MPEEIAGRLDLDRLDEAHEDFLGLNPRRKVKKELADLQAKKVELAPVFSRNTNQRSDETFSVNQLQTMDHDLENSKHPIVQMTASIP